MNNSLELLHQVSKLKKIVIKDEHRFEKLIAKGQFGGCDYGIGLYALEVNIRPIYGMEGKFQTIFSILSADDYSWIARGPIESKEDASKRANDLIDFISHANEIDRELCSESDLNRILLHYKMYGCEE